MKTFRGKLSYSAPTLFIPCLLTLGVFLDGDFELLLLHFSLWVPFVLLTLMSLGMTLEIGSNYIEERFLGFTTKKIFSHTVEGITYGRIPFGIGGSIYSSKSVIHGNGLAILVSVGGTTKTYALSEKLYGKEAIGFAKSVLTVK